jgi:fatty acid/phospholipid biosynthesis enzyme
LGVEGVVIITHGRAKSKTIANAILTAAKEVKKDLLSALRQIPTLEKKIV